MKLRAVYIIYLILIFGLILRLVNINQSLWLDEAINVLAAKNLGFWHLVTIYPIGDFHPPGYFALLWIWSHIFGFTETAVRMPSVLLGVGTIGVVYLIGKDFFNKRTAILSAFLLSINPLHVYYSQEARMYAMAAFGVALSFFALIKLLQNNSQKFLWLYIFSLVLVLLSDYVAYVALPVQILYVVIYFRKKIKQVFLSQIAALVIFSPWLLIFPSQLANGRTTAASIPGWAQVVGGSSLKNLILVYVKMVIGRISIADKLAYSLVLAPIGLFYLFITGMALRKIKEKNALVLYWTFIPTILAFIISFYIPALSYFRMLFILPGFCLLTANSIFLLGSKWQKLFSGFIVLVSFICLFLYYTNPSFQREDWRGLKNYFESSQQKILVLFENNEVITPFAYYQQNSILNNSYQGGLKNFPANTIEDVAEISSSYQKIFLVDYLVGISDPNRVIDQKLTNMGYKVTKAVDFPSIGLVYEYSKL